MENIMTLAVQTAGTASQLGQHSKEIFNQMWKRQRRLKTS